MYLYTRKETDVTSTVHDVPYGTIFKNIAGTPALDVFDETQIQVLAVRQHVIAPLNSAGITTPVPTHQTYGTIFKSFGQGVNIQFKRGDRPEERKGYYIGYVFDQGGDVGDQRMDFETEIKYRDA